MDTLYPLYPLYPLYYIFKNPGLVITVILLQLKNYNSQIYSFVFINPWFFYSTTLSSIRNPELESSYDNEFHCFIEVVSQKVFSWCVLNTSVWWFHVLSKISLLSYTKQKHAVLEINSFGTLVWPNLYCVWSISIDPRSFSQAFLLSMNCPSGIALAFNTLYLGEKMVI